MRLDSVLILGVWLQLSLGVSGYPEPCDLAPKWVLDGVDPMEEFFGHVTLVALMELHCETCREQLEKLETLAEMVRNNRMTDVRYIIVAAKDEHPNFVNYYKAKLEPLGIMVVQETEEEPVWSYLNATANDFLIYDRCWRLRYYLPWPQSSLAEHKPVHNIYYAYHRVENPRRTCHSDCPTERPIRPNPKANRIGIQSAKAVLSQGHYRRTEDGGYEQVVQPEGGDSANEGSMRRPGKVSPTVSNLWLSTTGESDQLGTVLAEGEIEVELITQKPTRRPKPTRKPSRHRNHTRTDRRKLPKTTTTTTTPTTTTTVKTTTADCEEGEICEAAYPDAESEGTIEYSVETVTTADKATELSTVQAKIVQGKPESLEGEKSVEVKTTVKPTKRPFKSPTVYVDGHNCSATVTDQYCLEQQQKGKPFNPCCYKGVYLTKLCDPNGNKCGKNTQNLCCFQKLQQSRFRCCRNSSTPNRYANDFSRCCFNYFAMESAEDPCCPRSVAQKFWQLKASRVAELCLPNVQFDFTNVVLKSELENGETVEVALKEEKIAAALNYECPYKATEELYIYEPTDKDGEFDEEIKDLVDQHDTV